MYIYNLKDFVKKLRHFSVIAIKSNRNQKKPEKISKADTFYVRKFCIR